ncbi:MAG: hypothetical protein JWP63_1423 [Candidatus Solibacter sp.]|nr:hypothetical protein [Candidatus Solibacter sp.]
MDRVDTWRLSSREEYRGRCANDVEVGQRHLGLAVGHLHRRPHGLSIPPRSLNLRRGSFSTAQQCGGGLGISIIGIFRASSSDRDRSVRRRWRSRRPPGGRPRWIAHSAGCPGRNTARPDDCDGRETHRYREIVHREGGAVRSEAADRHFAQLRRLMMASHIAGLNAPVHLDPCQRHHVQGLAGVWCHQE